MINLLPQSEKEALIQDEKWKLVLILGILGLVFFVFFSFILLAININIAGEVEAQKITLETIELRLKEMDPQGLEGKIAGLNADLSKLEFFYKNQVYLTGILETLSGDLPEGVYLTNFSYHKGKDNNPVSLSGFSPSREALAAFKTNLEKEKGLQQVYFPSSNWVKPKAIDFLVTFNLAK